ncbi:MAG: carboxypeptidase regulatory-like domain-containing protein [bacterium]
MTRGLMLSFLSTLLTACTGWSLTLSGTVVEPDGKTPVQGIVVQVEHHENRKAAAPDSFLAKAITGTNGGFAITIPDSQAQYMVFLSDEKGHVFTGYAHVSTNTSYGTMVLQRGCALGGKVRDAAGKPVQGAQVALDIRLHEYTCSHFIEAARAVTDSNGEFSFSDLSPAEYSYRMTSPDLVAKGGTCQVSDELAYLEIRLENPASIKGCVKNEQGQPVAGVAIVSEMGRRTLTDELGNYVLPGLVAGPHRLSVSGGGYVARDGSDITVRCTAGETATRDITVIKAGSLRLVLQPAEAGAIVPETLQVMFTMAGGSISARTRFMESLDAAVSNNAAIFNNIPPGKYNIQSANEDTARFSTNVVIAGGQQTEQVITLAKAISVKGKVVGTDGTPLSDATVVAQAMVQEGSFPFGALFARPDYTVNAKRDQTSETGEFNLAGLRPGRWQLTVTHSGGSSTNRTIVITGSVTIDPPFVVSEGMKISGIVLEADGKPASDVLVTASFKPTAGDQSQFAMYGMEQKSANVSADGKFVLAGLDAGTYALQVTCGRSSEPETTLDSVQAGADDIVITLARKHTIDIEVTGTDGSPLKGVTVYATKHLQEGQDFYMSERMQTGDRSVTDSNGKLTLSLRAGTKYRISCSLHPMLPRKKTLDLQDGATPPASPVKIVMEPGQIVTGTVTGSDGKPVSGLTVSFTSGNSGFAEMYAQAEMESLGEWDEDGEQPEPSSRLPKPTDAQGRFSVDGVAPGVTALTVLSRTNNERIVLLRKDVKVEKGKPNDISVQLPPLCAVKGIVLDAQGSPMPGCQVFMMSSTPPIVASRNTETDENGAFLFTDVPAGKYTIQWMNANAGDAFRPSRKALDLKGGRTEELILGGKKQDGLTLTIAGTVIIDGTPATGGTLSLMHDAGNAASVDMLFGAPNAATVTSDGTFKVSGVTTGAYVYYYMGTDGAGMPAHESTASGSITCNADTSNLVISISGGTVTGTVTDPDGKPIPGASIILAPPRMTTTLREYRVKSGITGPEGNYSIRHVPPGAYRLGAQHDEFAATTIPRVEVSVSSNTWNLTLAKGATVSGTVTDDTGSPIAGAMILAASDVESFEDFQEDRAFGTSGEDGSFSLRPPLPPGKHRILATSQGFTVESLIISTPSVTNFNPVLSVGGDIAVTITENGKPVAGKAVHAKDSDGTGIFRIRAATEIFALSPIRGMATAVTDETGKTRILGLRPGRYSVSVEGSGKSVDVTVKQLEATDVTLDL